MTDQKVTNDEQGGYDEHSLMHIVAGQFERRAKAFNLKGVKLNAQMEAFYEGAMIVAVNTGRMTAERVSFIRFYTAIGRLNELHKDWLSDKVQS